jgi:hypothetical protein
VWKDFAGPAVTLIGFAVTTTLAIIGLNTFDRWKREKIEEKRIDEAVEALACAYEENLYLRSYDPDSCEIMNIRICI